MRLKVPFGSLFLLFLVTGIFAQDCPAVPDSVYYCGYSDTLVGPQGPGIWTHLCTDTSGIVEMMDLNDSSVLVTVATCGQYAFIYDHLTVDTLSQIDSIYQVNPMTMDSIFIGLDTLITFDILCLIQDTVQTWFGDPSSLGIFMNSDFTLDYIDLNCTPSTLQVACDNVISIPPIDIDVEWCVSVSTNFSYLLYDAEIVSDSIPDDCLAEDIQVNTTSGGGSATYEGCFTQSELTDPSGDAWLNAVLGILGDAFFDVLGQLPSSAEFCDDGYVSEMDPLDPDSCMIEILVDTVGYLEIPILVGGHWVYQPAPDSTIALQDTTQITYNDSSLVIVVDPNAQTYQANFEVWHHEWTGTWDEPPFDVSIIVEWVPEWEIDSIPILDLTINLEGDCPPPQSDGCGGFYAQLTLGAIPPIQDFPCGPIQLDFFSGGFNAGAGVTDCWDDGYQVTINVSGGVSPYTVIGLGGTWISSNTFVSDSLSYDAPTDAIMIDDSDCFAEVSWSPCACVGPAVDAGPDLEVSCLDSCTTISGSFTSGVNPGTFLAGWFDPDGNFLPGDIQPVCDLGNFNYFVEHIPSGCASNDQMTISIPPIDPIINGLEEISCNVPFVDLTAWDLNADPIVTDYLWSGPEVNPLQVQEQTITVGLPGTYSVEITNIITGCTEESTILVTIDTLAPMVDLGPDLVLSCVENFSATLENAADNSGLVVDYDWLLNGNDLGLEGPAITIDAAGIYTLLATNIANGCASQIDLLAELAPDPILQVSVDSSCFNSPTGSVTLTLENPPNTELSFQLNDLPSQTTPFFSDLAGGNYTALATDGAACSFMVELFIPEIPPVDINREIEVIVCGQDEAFAQPVDLDLEPGWELEWPDGTSVPPYQIEEAGDFAAVLRTTCETIELPFSLEQALVDLPNYEIPNVFTPNGDGRNDTWRPLTGGVFNRYDLSIYNRFGQEVYSTTNPDRPWDGRQNGVEAPIDVYAWVLKAHQDGCQEEFDIFLHGEVSLLR